MTASLVVGYLMAAVFGFIGGLFIINKTPNHQANEVRLGTILFIIVCVLWIFTGEFESAIIGVLHMGLLWLLLTAGIYLGEKAHSKLVQHFMASLHKKDIEYGITELVRMGQQAYHMRRSVDMERFRSQKSHVLACLTELKRKSVNLKSHDIARQVDNVADLVIKYTDLISTVCETQEASLVVRCTEIGNDLLEVANYTLCYAEHVLRGSLASRFNVGLFR